jgi:prepilin-type N-terminal cleavage/methylation domain-containing protein
MAARRRSAFTLVEILLVLAVLVVMAGLVWPAIWKFVGEMRLRQGADDTRLSMAATRMRALEAGEAYRWLCQPGGRWYAALRVDAEPPVGGPTSSRPAWRSLGELPEGVVFDSASLSGASQQTVPTTLLAGLTGAERIDDKVVWAEVVRFQSDGSSRGAKLDVADASGRAVSLEVRSLTGSVTEGPMEVRRAP